MTDGIQELKENTYYTVKWDSIHPIPVVMTIHRFLT